jgi:hypothetical protein
MIERAKAQSSEPSPRVSGVSYERRLILALPLLAAGSTVLGTGRARAAGGLAFASFASSCRSLAAELLDKGELDPDEYLSRIGSLGTTLDPSDVPVGKLGAYGGLEPKVELGPVHRDMPIVAIQWRFAPGAVLPPHNHTPAHVLSLCLGGECRVRHFDVVGEAPALGDVSGQGEREPHSSSR